MLREVNYTTLLTTMFTVEIYSRASNDAYLSHQSKLNRSLYSTSATPRFPSLGATAGWSKNSGSANMSSPTAMASCTNDMPLCEMNRRTAEWAWQRLTATAGCCGWPTALGTPASGVGCLSDWQSWARGEGCGERVHPVLGQGSGAARCVLCCM